MSPALAGRFSTTAPPGKPTYSCFILLGFVLFFFSKYASGKLLRGQNKAISIVDEKEETYGGVFCNHGDSFLALIPSREAGSSLERNEDVTPKALWGSD